MRIKYSSEISISFEYNRQHEDKGTLELVLRKSNGVPWRPMASHGGVPSLYEDGDGDGDLLGCVVSSTEFSVSEETALCRTIKTAIDSLQWFVTLTPGQACFRYVTP